MGVSIFIDTRCCGMMGNCIQKERLPEGRRLMHVGILLVPCSSIGADDPGRGNTLFPIFAEGNRIPFFCCAFKSYTREAPAIAERTTANARNTISNRYTRKFSAITERTITNARYAIGYVYAR